MWLRKKITKVLVTISIWRFVDRYDEFWGDLFTKSYQESEIFLVVKFEYVKRSFGRLNDNQTFGLRYTNLKTWTQKLQTQKSRFWQKRNILQNFVTEKIKFATKIIKNELNSINFKQICSPTFFQFCHHKIIKITHFKI